MKISVVLPGYFKEDILLPLYYEMEKKLFSCQEYDWEVVMVNDGSRDRSYSIMGRLAARDRRIKIYSLSRNFGSHAAILCGLSKCTGDCSVVKAADLQEPAEIILEMVESWKTGNRVVLAVRKDRQEGRGQTMFAALYYWMVRKSALPQMPKGGFDVYLLDKRVIHVLLQLDEKNSVLTGQILWSGFQTGKIYYTRLQRTCGTSRWTLQKKLRLVSDTLFSFSTLPVTVVSLIGILSSFGAVAWAVAALILKQIGWISVSAWMILFMFQLFCFGIIMLTLGVLGGYLWRTLDASRNRPPYIVEEDQEKMNDKTEGTSEKGCKQDAGMDA